MEYIKDQNSFRISAKRILLSYSQVDTKFTLNHVLEQLQRKVGRFSYVISKEQHKDGGIHFHALLIHRRKFNIKSPHTLDLEIDGITVHGNYIPVKNLDSAVFYVCKDKQYITNLENLHEGELLTAKEFIYQQVQLKGVDKALLEYSQTHKEKALAGVSVSALKKHFSDIQKIELATKIEKIDTPFLLKHFNLGDELQEWVQNPDKTLIVVGRSEIGKTQFLKAFVTHKKLKTLVVKHKEDLRRLNDTYDAILIDDANIHEIEETQLLGLIDNQAYQTLRVLYDTVHKKQGVVQMIAMNKNEFRKIKNTLQQDRFSRRILVIKPREPFMINVCVNVHLHNHIQNNHIHNNYMSSHKDSQMQDNAFEEHQKVEKEYVKKMQERLQLIDESLD